MQTLSVIFLKDEMPELKTMISVMNVQTPQHQCEILLETDIPGTELISATMLVTDPSDLYSLGLLIGIERSRKVSMNILKKLNR